MAVLRQVQKTVRKIRNRFFPYDDRDPSRYRDIVNRYHQLYYGSQEIFDGTYWLGVHVRKCPLDLWVYQEIIFEIKPDFIIECGTADGGSALYMASMCDIVKQGNIVTIDIRDRTDRPQHDRIKYLLGSSTSREIVDQVREMARDKRTVMVVLDSDHSMDHVLEELHTYSPLVTKGSYMIVEDTNLNGHPVSPDFGPGPMEAVQKFLRQRQDFAVDRKREKFFFTYNPSGYLQKIQ